MKSIRKGKRAENEVLEILRQWWGGEGWRRSGLGFNGGDLLTPANFPFEVEIKHRARSRVAWLFQPTEEFLKWIRQARDQAVAKGRGWLLCAKIEGTWYGVTSAVDEIGPELPEHCPRLLHPQWFVFPLRALIDQ